MVSTRQAGPFGAFFLFGFTIILVAPGVTILPPEITRRAVLFGVKFCLREKPLSSPLPSAGLCADPRSRVRLAFVLPYAVLSLAILGIRGNPCGSDPHSPNMFDVVSCLPLYILDQYVPLMYTALPGSGTVCALWACGAQPAAASAQLK